MNLKLEQLLDRFHDLTPHRQAHILRVVVVMEELANRHDLDFELSRWAGFGHDLAREFDRHRLLEEARRLGLTIDRFFRQEPVLLHGPIAATWLRIARIGNASVWQAIWQHTTAGPGLSPLAKALYVADGAEPGRCYPEREGLLETAMEDLEAGYRGVLRQSVQYAHRRGLEIHSDTQRALAEAGVRDLT